MNPNRAPKLTRLETVSCESVSDRISEAKPTRRMAKIGVRYFLCNLAKAEGKMPSLPIA